MKHRYFYPDDVETWTDKDGNRQARLALDRPVILTGNETGTALEIWLQGRDNYRAHLVKLFLDERDVVRRFWEAHKVADYDPQNPKWTRTSYGPEAVTMQHVKEWAASQAA